MPKFLSLVLICTTMLLTACAGLKERYLSEPKVNIDHVDVKDTTLTGTTLLFVLKIQNPNEMDIDIEKVTYNVFLNNKSLAGSSTEKPVKVLAKGETQVILPLPVTFSKILDGAQGLLKTGSLPYKIKGDAKLSFFTIPFSSEGKVEL